MKNDIAIIGMAGRFPGARNINELCENLKNGADSVSSITEKRLKETTLPPDDNYKVCGYLDDIDKFDYKLFNISYLEAVNMSPAQRLLLEIAYETFENAGYNPDDFNGSNTSVYTPDSIGSTYTNHADEFNPTLVTGNSQEFLASKISRQFNLLGNSVVLTTSCSSSLVCLNLACNELILGDCDYALICGINLNLFPYPYDGIDLGLSSKSGKSKAFSADTEGMSFGEIACAILIKRFDEAIKDKDNIHAVIKGWSVNNNGNKSTSILAPHSNLQAEVIKKAWKKAGINPCDIGFIEAHGSGTKLGDCLEVEGLTLAFREFTNKKQFVPISTIKSNIGHCMLAAGMAGLIKAILSIKDRVLFPNIHCQTLNPTIDFENSPVYVNTKLKTWENENNSRIAGITSLGRSGINSHFIIQEFNQKETEPLNENFKKSYLFTISSNTENGLKENLKNLLNQLGSFQDKHLKDISFTLINGRKHYQYRVCFICNSLKELKQNISAALKKDYQAVTFTHKKLFFVFSDPEINQNGLQCFIDNYILQENKLTNLPDSFLNDPRFTLFNYQYCFYYLLKKYNLTSNYFISSGIGKIVKDIILGEKSLEQVENEIKKYEKRNNPNLENNIKQFIIKEGNENLLIIDMGEKSEISKLFSQLSQLNIKYLNVCTDLTCNDPFINLIKTLYLSDLQFPVSGIFKDSEGVRIELPAYSFEKTRCWLRKEPRKKETAEKIEDATYGVLIEKDASDLEYAIGNIIAEVLDKKRISVHDDFFEMGGDSLKATKVINEINRQFKVELDFEDIFDFPTIKTLAKNIFDQMSTETVIAKIWQKVLGIEEEIKPDDNFFDLGGHSLLTTQAINYIKNNLSVSLNFDDFFFHSTLSGLSAYIDKLKEENSSSKSAALKKAEKREYYPVSYAQRGLLYMQQMYKSGTSYDRPSFYMIEGDFDVNLLENVFKKLIERHEILRTSFFFKDNEPFQRIHEHATLNIIYDDISKTENRDIESVIEERMEKFVIPFDSSIPSSF